LGGFLELFPRNVSQFWQVLNFTNCQQKQLRNSKSKFSTFIAKVATKLLAGTKETLQCCLELLQDVVTINIFRLATCESVCQKKEKKKGKTKRSHEAEVLQQNKQIY